MKLFIKRVCFVCTCVCLLLVIYFGSTYYFIYEYNAQGYNAAIIDKIARLESINTPKIILTGDSNLAFGINSEMIQEETGMEVVNLGLHGGLGNEFLENMAKYNIGAGDIVVVAHTDYSDDSYSTKLIIETVLGQNYLYNVVPKSYLWKIVKTIPSYTIDTWQDFVLGSNNDDSSDIYQRKWFNEYGDVNYPREELILDFDASKSIGITEISQKTVNRLNLLNEYCVEKGAKLVIAAYPIIEVDDPNIYGAVQDFQQELDEKVDAPVISNFTDYILHHMYFYDTYEHLNDDGTLIRTTLLIDELNNYIESLN